MAAQDLNAMAFPKLTEEQMTQLARHAGASTKTFRAGQALFRAGDRDPRFFVIRSGELEIIDITGDQPKTIRVQGPGEFTGDVGHLTGSPKVVSAIARADCEVYEMSEAELRKVLNQDPQLSDVILQAFIARRQLMRESPAFTGLRVIGSRYSRDTFRIRDFLAKNRVLFTWLDLEGDPAVKEVLQQFGVTEADTPIVACAHCLVLRNPSNRELAEKIGIRRPVDHIVYDLAIVGSGPAGLAAAVYGASEGLNTIVLEHTAPGGQAGSSMRIENYLGFPTGITGSELAERAVLQADKFGANISVPTPVAKLTFERRIPFLNWKAEKTLSPNVYLSPLARSIDGWRLRTAVDSKAPVSIMPPHLTRRRCAAARMSCWWAAATLPARRRSIFRRTCARSSSSSAAMIFAKACRVIWPIGS